ncbi:MAG: hypothetical protein D6696_13955 [Acidobacteria bacterium]|nr:MAG: hypothetical protein D6696_13955 [Acidobacteriota bacterium]
MNTKHHAAVVFSTLVLLAPFALVAQPPAPPAPPAPSADALTARLLELTPGGEDLSEQPSQSFQVHLLVADVGSGETSFEGLSKSAQKALVDLRDFLPFTTYRLLDFAWLRSSGYASAKMRGPEERLFRVSLRHRSPSEETGGQIFVSHFELSESSETPVADALRSRVMPQGAVVAPLARTPLISTSFRMEVGETVVVGTSRLDGERKALVVLLTAVPES